MSCAILVSTHAYIQQACALSKAELAACQVVTETYLVLIDNAAVWMNQLDLSMGVHIPSLRGRIEPEALTPSQQQVQVVMEIMMQPTTSPCKHI